MHFTRFAATGTAIMAVSASPFPGSKEEAVSAAASYLHPFRGGTNLPTGSFLKFNLLSLNDAKQGKILKGHHGDVSTVMATTPTLTATLAPTTVAEDTTSSPILHYAPGARGIGGQQGEKDRDERSVVSSVTARADRDCETPSIRQEWQSYSASNRQSLVSAIRCLMTRPPSGDFSPSTNRYEDFVRLHQQNMGAVHNNAIFPIWHRYLVWAFEQELRDVCNFTAPFVWWDETKVAGAFASSDVFSSRYFGTLKPASSSSGASCVTDGAFANLTCNIGPGTATNTPHCLSRRLNEALTSQCNSDFVITCHNITDYSHFESCSEDGPHAYGHNGIGGVMSDVYSSPSDPVFWLHHTFVDHEFFQWQNANYTVRTTTIDGTISTGAAIGMDTPLNLNGIRPTITVGDVLSTRSGTKIGGKSFCYRYDYWMS